MGLTDLDERVCTHGEAVKSTGITSKNLNNWTQRGLTEHIGKLERSGRRMYSANDLVRLRVIGGLVEQCAMTPAFAAQVTDLAKVGKHLVFKDPKTGYLRTKFAAPPAEQTFLVGWVADEKTFSMATVLGANLLLALNANPHPTIVIPLDVIADEVVTNVISLLEQEDS